MTSWYLAKRSSSGGRIPTDKGFRRYAQTADMGVELSRENQEILLGEIYRRGLELTEAISETGRILSVLSKLMALVVLPAASDQKLDRLEFVGLSRSRVLVVLVTEDDMILEGIADLPRDRSYFSSVSGSTKSWSRSARVAWESSIRPARKASTDSSP